jgi:murein DD-endopeptidase MepM/ murein hydrolase activator NlpD
MRDGNGRAEWPSRYAETMIGSRILRLFFTMFVAAGTVGAQTHPGSPVRVAITPQVVVAGSPELIRIPSYGIASVEGQWLGRKLQFFHGADGKSFVALAGIDVEAPPGPSTLHISALAKDAGSVDLSREVEIHPAHYRTGALTVSPKFVEPPPEALKEIEEEGKLKQKVYAASAAEPLWRGSFHPPLSAKPTDSFGTRRMFNGKLASIHKGADFHAAAGTPVHASNSGVVVLARPLYYEGNCVIIDHGLGLFTLSMHFSRIDVHEGQHVKAGDRLGLSGATGRVTGPHLHWAVRWQGAMLDPVKLLHLDLDEVRLTKR